jgi:tryptophanyl-tRNA synthetase
MKKRILSGMRPTGPLHIGHLLGALGNWVRLQEEYQSFFMIADWHALMSEYAGSNKIAEYSLDNLKDWLSAGLDPEKSVIFRQSDVLEHTELNLILSIITPLGWLQRCPTYKEQIKELQDRDLSTHGFLGYPVLQAADILLYKAQVVPVGEDQLPHLEFTRELLRRFQHLFGKDIFPEPEALLAKTPKLLGLDGRKMSKSYGNYIALSDKPEVIREKVKGMFTDPKRLRRQDPGRPEACNLYKYYQAFSFDRAFEIKRECEAAEIGCVEDKENLAEFLIEYLRPLRQKREALSSDIGYLNKLLKEGAETAREVAKSTIAEVRGAVGL